MIWVIVCIVGILVMSIAMPILWCIILLVGPPLSLVQLALPVVVSICLIYLGCMLALNLLSIYVFLEAFEFWNKLRQ